MSETLAIRERYRPDGRMKWGLFPLLVVTPLAAAVAAAALMNVLYEHGFYFDIIVAFAAAAGLGGLTCLLVWWSHCRKPLLVGMLGLSVGLVGYLGYYHFGFLRCLPPGLAHRVDLLPFYITFRMNTDVHVDPARPVDEDDPPPEVDDVDVVFNWLLFIAELGIFVGCTTGIPWSRAKRAYCVELGQWMTRERIRLLRGQGEQLRAAFEEGDLDRFVRIAHAGQASDQSPSTCVLEYVRTTDRSPLEFPVYLSVTDPRLSGSTLFFLLGRRPRFRQVLLELRETLELRPLFPGLAAALAGAHQELRNVPDFEGAGATSTAPQLPDAANEVAEITPVPDLYRGRVFTRRHVLMTNVLGFSPAVAFFGGGGLIALGAYLLENGCGGLVTIPLFSLGALGVLIGAVVAFRYPLLSEDLYGRRKMRHALRERLDSLVDADDPDAVFVGITPRENWGSLKLEIASDIGLLKLDRERSEVRIEADHERFRIPCGSLIVCEPECFHHPLDARTQHWLVRLVVRFQEGTREVLFGLGHTNLKPRTNTSRHDLAADMCRRIHSLALPHS